MQCGDISKETNEEGIKVNRDVKTESIINLYICHNQQLWYDEN